MKNKKIDTIKQQKTEDLINRLQGEKVKCDVCNEWILKKDARERTSLFGSLYYECYDICYKYKKPDQVWIKRVQRKLKHLNEK